MDWALPWHDTSGMDAFKNYGRKCKPWSEMRLRRHWNLAHYCALLPDHRWLKPVLHWTPGGRKRIGHAKHYWDSILANFCRLKDLLSWEIVAMAMGHDLWCSMLPEFFILVQTLMYIRISLTFVPLCLKQAAHLDI